MSGHANVWRGTPMCGRAPQYMAYFLYGMARYPMYVRAWHTFVWHANVWRGILMYGRAPQYMAWHTFV